ncbi:MAG: winged helix DNA-binding protein [Pseudomonadota bacterium]
MADAERPKAHHLSQAQAYEHRLSEFEYAIWHLGAAFARWRRDCLASVSQHNLTNTEGAILHAVHMMGSEKGLMEIARLLHRGDIPNLQYGLKKLTQLGLVERKGRSRKAAVYAVTASGKSIVDAYLTQRREVLLRLFMEAAPSPDHLEELVMRMHVMIGLYDQSSDLLLSRQP